MPEAAASLSGVGSTFDVGLDSSPTCPRHRPRKSSEIAGANRSSESVATVMRRALPILNSLSEAKLANFIFHHAQLSRTLKLTPSCGSLLRRCVQSGILLGIASNAQAYTLRELQVALKKARLDLAIFQADLTFWSFQHVSANRTLCFRLSRAAC
jgi:hypothetical protein